MRQTEKFSRLIVAISAIVFASLLSACPPLSAQGLPPAEGQSVDELFREVLRDPTNLDLSFKYAAAAVEAGQLETAITALERMLIFNPDLPRVQLELGVLYFRLGSFAMAQSYFEKAISGADVPDEVRQRVAQYLAEIAARSHVHQFSGTVAFGLQMQSDANAAPGSSLVRAQGFDASISDQFTKRSDQNLFTTGSVFYGYDLGRQDRDAIEVSGVIFGSRYFRQHHLDLAVFETTAGPRLNLDPYGLAGSSAKPYLIANEVLLSEKPYFNTYGIGLELIQPAGSRVQLRLDDELRQKNYVNDGSRPHAREFTGNDDLLSLTAAYLASERSVLSLSGSFTWQSTRKDFHNNQDYGVSLSYQLTYDDPTGLLNFPWVTTASAGRSFVNYQAPDPDVDPDTKRLDRHWRFGVGQVVPVTERIAIVIQAQREVVSSTLPNFAYTNTSFTFGAQLRF